MIGHTISTYHNIKMKGARCYRIPARNLYRIKPVNKAKNPNQQDRRPQRNHTRMGTKPRRNPNQRCPHETHCTIIDNSQLENHQLTQLTTALRQQMLKEIRENDSQKSIKSCLSNGSPGEIRTLVNGSKGHYACPLHHRAMYQTLCVSSRALNK